MTVAAVILLAAAVWIGSLYLRPFGRCPRCHGQGHVRTCKGLRRAQRLGSRTVHRLARSIRAEAERTRQQRATSASREDQP